MKKITYSTVEIQIMADGSTAQAIYDRGEHLEDAVTAWHGTMNSLRTAVDNGTLSEATGFVVNSWGSVEMPYSEHYAGKQSAEIVPLQ